jgi:CBS domain-containing protein
MNDVIEAGKTPISALVSDLSVGVTGDANLWEIARIMTDAEVGLLVVDDGGETPIGVVSERDVTRALAQGRNPDGTTARDLCHLDIAWCDSSATVVEVGGEMMRRYIRHVLVEEDGRLVGVVSSRDLLGAYLSLDEAADSDEE